MGQGRNVLHLASQDWVTGIDISEEGIRLAKAAATKQKLKFDAVVQDMKKYDFGVARWDLVTMIYAGARRLVAAQEQARAVHRAEAVTTRRCRSP
jgi:ubiquinone/menaquinone biosynthesis C-methylase UbiE